MNSRSSERRETLACSGSGVGFGGGSVVTQAAYTSRRHRAGEAKARATGLSVVGAPEEEAAVLLDHYFLFALALLAYQDSGLSSVASVSR